MDGRLARRRRRHAPGRVERRSISSRNIAATGSASPSSRSPSSSPPASGGASPASFGQIVHAVFAGTFGRVAYAVPLVLLGLGLRMLRAPQDEASTNRIVVGTIALTFAACGLAHLAEGIPNPPDGADGMRAAGGILGFLASSPLAAAVSTYGAVVLLILLGLFGLLVVTATPVNMIPTRLRQLRDLVIDRSHDADDAAETRRTTPRAAAGQARPPQGGRPRPSARATRRSARPPR